MIDDAPAIDFADALRSAISSRGLSLLRIRHHLSARGHDLSIATLSYWQSGRSLPDRPASLAALGALEEILGVPRGSLAAHLPLPRRRGGRAQPPDAARPRPLASIGIADAIAHSGLGVGWGEGYQLVSVQDMITVDEHGAQTRITTRALVQARRSGFDRFPVAHAYDPDHSVVRGEGTLNCRLGRVIDDPERDIAVLEVVLERPLQEGEFTLCEFVVHGEGSDYSALCWERGLAEQTREALIEVSFAPQTTPAWIESFTVVDEKESAVPVFTRQPTVTRLHSDFGPGVCGLRWGW